MEQALCLDHLPWAALVCRCPWGPCRVGKEARQVEAHAFLVCPGVRGLSCRNFAASSWTTRLASNSAGMLVNIASRRGFHASSRASKHYLDVTPEVFEKQVLQNADPDGDGEGSSCEDDIAQAE